MSVLHCSNPFRMVMLKCKKMIAQTSGEFEYSEETSFFQWIPNGYSLIQPIPSIESLLMPLKLGNVELKICDQSYDVEIQFRYLVLSFVFMGLIEKGLYQICWVFAYKQIRAGKDGHFHHLKCCCHLEI